MTMRILGGSLATLGLSVAMVLATAQLSLAQQAPAADGAAAYAKACASCHGKAGEGGSAPKVAGRADFEDTFDIIRDGIGTMGPTGGLTEAEMMATAKYVAQLGK